MVSIATWNINSVRLRIDQVVRLLEQERPDVLCLQEIKCREEQFPHAAFEALGYTHRVVHGQKGYHGVATVSRIPMRRRTELMFQVAIETIALRIGMVRACGKAGIGRSRSRGGGIAQR